VRLHHYANNKTNTPFSFMVPDLPPSDDTAAEEDTSPVTEGRPVGIDMEEMDQAEASDFFFDMKLAGEPIQCDETDGTCEDMA
jgi:beta-1,2-xylosyltransferase